MKRPRTILYSVLYRDVREAERQRPGIRCVHHGRPNRTSKGTDWRYTAKALAAVVARSKVEILEDMHAGIVPCHVSSFAELHDYVDANGYGGAFEEPFDGSGEACRFWNAVQDTLDAWIKAGRPLTRMV